MIEDGLRKLLIADATVSGLIGTHLYPLDLPEDVDVTAATYQVISTVDEMTLDGPTGLVQGRIQFDARSPRYGAAKALAKAIYDAIVSNEPVTLPNGVTVYSAQRENSFDRFEPGARWYVAMADYLVWYSLP